MPRKRFFSIGEALEMINHENFTGEDVDITVIPPDSVDTLTDEENVDDGGTGEIFVEDVSGCVEIHYKTTKQQVDKPAASNTVASDDVQPVSKRRCATTRNSTSDLVAEEVTNTNSPRRKVSVRRLTTGGTEQPIPSCSRQNSTEVNPNTNEAFSVQPKWVKKTGRFHFDDHTSTKFDIFRSNIVAEYGNMTPTELFEQLFTNEIFEMIARETQRYAGDHKNESDFSICANEMSVCRHSFVFRLQYKTQ